ncbi:hypothetical protein [Synechococcus sp. WH 8016]|uniref:hypothetical protein n=1 Tax=Synechococcus sp. WH 8016 TaxID=166318 RepID=UPI0020A61E02|nr:hypothetical protein [Synechococcus sp. WH 8016]
MGVPEEGTVANGALGIRPRLRSRIRFALQRRAWAVGAGGEPREHGDDSSQR